MHRFYIKTVQVLTDARLTLDVANDAFTQDRARGEGSHRGHDGRSNGKKERRLDKWVSL